MKLKFKAAVGSLLISGALAGAAVMPTASSAHPETGPLCYGYYSTTPMWRYNSAGQPEFGTLWQNQPFRIFVTQILSDGNFWSLGHSSTTNQEDFWVRTQHLRC